MANIKGGVGKTTTTANLAAALAERGRRVLAVDLDPQASLTLAFGLNSSRPSLTIREALDGTASPLSTTILPTGEGFDLVPANRTLHSVERELDDGRVRIFALRDAIEPIRERYDFILLDCPASPGVLTGNALAAADQVIVPFPPDYLDLEAVDWLLRIIRETQRLANPNLRVAGFLLAMYTPRTRHTREIVDLARARYGVDIPFFGSTIQMNVRLREAPLSGKSVLKYATESVPAAAYRSLAREVEEGIREAEPEDAESAVRQGRQAMAEGDLLAAYRSFTVATAFNPELSAAWIGRAQTVVNQDEAIRCWAKVLQLAPANAEARAELEARISNRIKESQVIDVPELMAVGHYLLELNQFRNAEPLFRRVTELDPKHQDSWFGLARCSMEPVEAVKLAEHALQINPANTRAKKELEAARSRVVNQATVLVDQARGKAQAGAKAEAYQLYKRAAELDPRNARAWLGLARTGQDPASALGSVRNALEADPENQEAKDLYHWLWKPEREPWEFPISWQMLLSVGLALVILVGALFLILQHYNP